MDELLVWLLMQKGWLMFGFAVVLYIVLLIMWFGYEVFWPWGFGMATVLGGAGLLFGGSKE